MFNGCSVMNEHPKQLTLTPSQIKEIQQQIAQRHLDDHHWEILTAIVETLLLLYTAISEKNIAIRNLLKQLFGPSSETSNKGKRSKGNPSRQNPTPPKGHGRNGADQYPNADKTSIPHPELKSGDLCPACETGRVYEMSEPSIIVRVVADAPLKAHIYERERLRCNLCGIVFTAELPEEVSESKYDESVSAMLALLRYGCGMPLNRLSNLQSYFGIPMPASTQWDLLDAAARILSPVYEHLYWQAAQGHILYNDDTTMNVLSFLDQTETTRKGVFTSGIVSLHEDHKIAIFHTGHHHAGENLNEMLKQRQANRLPPIQMADASTRNIPKDFQTILCNCLVHARRNFVNIEEHFPEQCQFVIDRFAQIYAIEERIKDRHLDPEQRLLEHQKHSAPLMQQIKDWCEDQLDSKKVEPNGSLGKAIRYLLKHWEKLTRFLSVPGAPLDNNICERTLKQAIIHRKNSLFYKTVNGAHVGDLFMSLIHTCHMVKANPFDYLSCLLKNEKRIQESPEKWMPWNYRNNPLPA